MQRIARSWTRTLAVACAAFLLGACEGLFTGKAAGSIPLQPAGDGGFKPVVVALTAEMSPVALNFHAELGNHPHETGKWNSYRATLSRSGRVVASQKFNVSYTGTVELAPAHPAQTITMLVHRVEENGEYTLAITPVRAVEVSLQNVRVDVRRNVQVPR
jgi:hypothetical protein